ncbi:MAG TPA: TIM barrel protein, partial [Candidatus Angelobacter sp.]|nr:TIM barrel protein [Candidatus Angelobacter sp.]
MPHLSLTTWSLHRNLGPLRWTAWDEETNSQTTRIEEQPETISLLELPAELVKQNFSSLEVCHFHFPRTDAEYLAQLRNKFTGSGLIFHCLLVDYGDISHADPVRRESDLTFIKKWIDIAERVGAKSVRVVAGEASPDDSLALARSIQGLKELVDYAEPKGVRIVTENFKPLASTSANCQEIISAGNQQIGLTVDFGNFNKAEKYEAIEALMPVAESVHAKANYNQEGLIDEEEYRRSLALVM